jgi:N-acyl-D-amino-acid deacylase
LFDLAINNGVVLDPVDGEYVSNIGVSTGKIEKIDSDFLKGRVNIDLNGEKVAPGFIDIHMHGGEVNAPCIFYAEIFDYMALMGVTTCVGGNCGLGSSEILKWEKSGLPVNYLCLVGHGALREKAGCTDRYRPASNNELAKMIALLEEDLEGGSLGLSFGLEYTPGAPIDELIKLCRVVSRYPNKLVSAHYRFDAARALEAIAELIIVARDAGVRFQISHLNSCTAFGQTDEGLRMIDAAYREGVDLGVDAYPYAAFSTFIGSAVFDPGCFEKWGVSYDAVLVCEGRYRGQRCSEEIFNYIRKHEPDSLVVAFVMREEEVVRAIRHPLVMIASDGILKEGKGHPRAAGAFPRVLGRYVREERHLDLVSAVKKMTLMPAERLGFAAKGRIKEGFDADLTIFNGDTIIDRATFENPTEPPFGIEYVFVNGIKVVEKGRLTGNLPGAFLSVQ